jgi:hypothetical protein
MVKDSRSGHRDCRVFASILPLKRMNNSFQKRRPRKKGPKSISRVHVNKSQVKQMIHSAMGQVTDKFLNVTLFNASSIPGTGTLYTPVFPSQGTTAVTRTGDSLHLDHIDIRIGLQTTIADDFVRILVIQAKASNVPAVTDVLTPGITGSVDYTSMVDPYKLNTEFALLKDLVVPLATGSTHATVYLHWLLRSSVSTVNFTPGTTVSTQGQVYLILLSTAVSATTTVQGQLRYKYHDL